MGYGTLRIVEAAQEKSREVLGRLRRKDRFTRDEGDVTRRHANPDGSLQAEESAAPRTTPPSV